MPFADLVRQRAIRGQIMSARRTLARPASDRVTADGDRPDTAGPSDAARCQTIPHPLQPREKSYGRAAALTGLQFRASDKSWIVLDN